MWLHSIYFTEANYEHGLNYIIIYHAKLDHSFEELEWMEQYVAHCKIYTTSFVIALLEQLYFLRLFY